MSQDKLYQAGEPYLPENDSQNPAQPGSLAAAEKAEATGSAQNKESIETLGVKGVEASEVDDLEVDDLEEAEEEREWWDDPALPWTGKPIRADYACLAWISVVAIYSFVMLPLQPMVLAMAPQFLGSLGYRTGLVMTGAVAAIGDLWWPLVLILGSILGAKFDWIYWWAGHRWGRKYINTLLGKTARARKRNAKFERLARKYETLAIAITYLPIPIPAGLIYVVLGEAGTSLKKFLTVDIFCAFVMAGIYMSLGFWIGEPAVIVMEQYAKYMWYVSLAIIVFMVAYLIWNAKKKPIEEDELSDEPDEKLLDSSKESLKST